MKFKNDVSFEKGQKIKPKKEIYKGVYLAWWKKQALHRLIKKEREREW